MELGENSVGLGWIFDDIVFDSKCLNDIKGFLDELNRMYKEENLISDKKRIKGGFC